MRAYSSVVPKSARSRSETHAAWNDDLTRTLCGNTIPLHGDWIVVKDAVQCPRCKSALRHVERAEGLTPGYSLTGPLAALYPPVVEPVEIPVSLDTRVIPLTGDDRLAQIWQRALAALRALDPAPVCEATTYGAALAEIQAVELVAGAFVVPLSKPAFECLAPFTATVREAVQQAGAPRVNVALVVRPAGADALAPASEAAPAKAQQNHDLQMLPANRRAILSLVQKERRLLEGQGVPEPMKAAIVNVAAILEPPVAPADLARFIAPPPGGPRAQPAAAEVPPSTPPPAGNRRTLRKPVRELMLDWFAAHATWPTDAILAHVTGLSHSAFAEARRDLKAAGWQFEHTGEYYTVTRPLSPEEIELAALDAQMAALQAQAATLRAALAERAKPKERV